MMNTFPITSKAFSQGQSIPSKFTCEGDNLSPALEWSSVPAGAKSLALIMDDPDAPMGTFVHWVIYNLPTRLAGLPEGVALDEQVNGIGTQGKNSAGRTGYTGPCPPPGKIHHYYFKVYALDQATSFAPGLGKAQLLSLIEGHILAQGQVMGTYER